MTKRPFVALAFLCALAACQTTGQTTGTSEWGQGEAKGQALICVPESPPPFPAVIYSHGIVIEQRGINASAQRGYDLRGLCKAFADSGFLAFMPIRHGPTKARPQFDELNRAITTVKARPDVDARRVSLAGMSRGGLLTVIASIRGQPVHSYVVMAPAPGERDLFNRVIGRIRNVRSPMLVMVELSDDDFIRDNVDGLERALQAAGKPYKVIRYDNGKGHLFFGTANSYWPDMIEFLRDPFRAVGTS